jgi:AcrR family transcriptional regulator
VSVKETQRAARWRRRKEARPAEIVAAALDCFAERGFAATRLDDVAARAGITKGTLYLYFRDKEDLFKAVVRQGLVPGLVRAEALLAQSDEPCFALLERLLLQWVELARTPLGAVPKIMLTEAGNFPELARFYVEEVIERGMGVFRALLKRGMARGEFRRVDVETAIHCIIAPVLLVLLWRHSFERHEGARFDPERLCRTHVALLERGLAGKGRDAATPRRSKRGAR